MNNEKDELERMRGRSRRKPEAAAGAAGQHRTSQSGSAQGRVSQSRASHSGSAQSRVSQNGSAHSKMNQSSLGLQESAAAEALDGHRSHVDRMKKEQEKKKKTRRRIITMIVAECIALVCIFGYAYFARRLNLMPRPDVDKNYVKNEDLQVEDLEKMKGYWMIALFGVDSRNGSVGAGNQSDVNMICCINQDTGEIKLVSVYRDTYLNTGENRYSKFNEAYAKGGPEQALKYLNKNLDLNITDYATFSWKAVAEAITILGGVDIDISAAEYRYINGFITETVEATGLGSHHLTSTGMQLLDGVQSVAYARLRLMDSDYARTERQKEVIKAAFEKAKTADYAKLNNILVTVLPQVSTNLDFADLTNVALNITKYHIGETAGFPSARGEASMGSKGACVIPQTLESNVSALHTFLFGDDGYTPTETVKQISAKISADTGMYTEGKAAGKVSTDGYLPKETKAQVVETSPQTSEEETTAEILETDEFGNPLETSEGETISGYPGIGETDEYGNLVDGPETEDPDIPLDESENYPGGPENLPGSTTPGGTVPSNGGTTPGGTEMPGGTRPSDGNRPLSPGDQVNPDEVTGPGVQNGSGTDGEDSAVTSPGDDGRTSSESSPGGTGDNSVTDGPSGSSNTTTVVDPRVNLETTEAAVENGPGVS